MAFEIQLEHDHHEMSGLKLSVDRRGFFTLTRSGLGGKSTVWFDNETARKIHDFLTLHLILEETNATDSAQRSPDPVS